jgi:hypothetical protein
MAFYDSIDKIVFSYFACITTKTFTYKGHTYHPRQLRVSPGLLREMHCPPMCGGCCGPYSLEYLPFEDHPYELTPRIIEFDGRNILVYSDLQEDNKTNHCKHLILEDGRCNIHSQKPFAADFELIKFQVTKKDDGRNQLTQKVFSRGWSYNRVDGGKGQLCYMSEPTKESVQDAARRMKRLRQWANYFSLSHCLDPVIEWMESGPHEHPLIVNIQKNDDLETNLFFEG